MAETNSQTGGENNPNRIFDMSPLAGLNRESKTPTSEEKVYRNVSGQGAIEDIHNSGVVRNAHDAGVKKGKNRWGNNVYWTRGKEGMDHSVQDGSFLIEAPHSVASQRQVRAEDITGVYQNRMGKVVNLLENNQIQNRPRRSRGFSGEQAKPSSIKYRIGIFSSIFLILFAGLFDLIELLLSLFLAAVGGYIKDFASILLFPILFSIFKIPFWKGSKKTQKINTMLVGYLIALVPILSDIVPELAISVAVTIFYSRVEDRLGIQGKLLEKNPKIITSKRIRQKIRKR